jgi:hypothetical protein
MAGYNSMMTESLRNAVPSAKNIGLPIRSFSTSLPRNVTGYRAGAKHVWLKEIIGVITGKERNT